MARRCILHLGMAKTGTTSIQKTFHDFENGDLFYARLGRANHSHALINAFSSEAETYFLNRLNGLRGPALARAGAALREALRAQIVATDRDMILSGENAASYLRRADIAGLGEFLGRYFDRIEVIAYLREPTSYITSGAQQRVRNGKPTFRALDIFPRYRQRFAKWQRGLPGAHFIYAPFDRQHFHRGDLILDFAHRTGIDSRDVPRHQRQDNTGLSAEAFGLLYVYRKHRGTFMRSGMTMAQNMAGVQNLTGFGSRKFAFRPWDLPVVQWMNRGQVRWAEARMGTRFPTPETAPGTWVFRGERGVRDCALASLPALRRHLPGSGVAPTGDEAEILARLDILFRGAGEP